MNTQQLAKLIANQARHEKMTDEKGINKLYAAIYTDAKEVGMGEHTMETGLAFASTAIRVKHGRFFSYFELPNNRVLITNKYH